MNQEKTVARVHAEVENKLVIETHEGLQQTYLLNPNRTMYLHVRHLQVFNEARRFRFGDKELGLAPATSLYVRGRAALEGGSISVVGDPDNKVHMLGIGFHALDEDIRYRREELVQRQGSAPHYTCARVGFVHHKLGLGNDDDWFVQCEVPPDTLNAISHAVSCGTMGEMTVGLALQGIYAAGDGTPQSAKNDWFLRPSRRDNTVEAPEMAQGDIALFSFEQALAHPARQACLS